MITLDDSAKNSKYPSKPSKLDYDDSKEITSLLSSNPKSYNNHSLKSEGMEIVKKRDFKNDNISSDSNKSFT
jgi:hypothetical protein